MRTVARCFALGALAAVVGGWVFSAFGDAWMWGGGILCGLLGAAGGAHDPDSDG